MISFNDIYSQVKSQYPNISVKKARMIAQDRFKKVKKLFSSFVMNIASHYERVKYCLILKNEEYKKKTGKDGYSEDEIEKRVELILLNEYGLSLDEAKKQECNFGMKTYDFRKNKHKEYGENELEEYKGLRKVRFGKDFTGSFETDEELSKAVDYKHDSNAGYKHRLAVEVLIEILRDKRHKVICNPDFALQRCDVLDQTTNVRYEIQSYNIEGKRKKCSENTVVIPIRGVTNDYDSMWKYIVEFLKNYDVGVFNQIIFFNIF